MKKSSLLLFIRTTFVMNNRGSILILLALAASILFIFIGLTLDSSLQKSMQREQADIADSIAKAALTGFSHEQNCISTQSANECRLSSALSRAEDIVRMSLEETSNKVQHIGIGQNAYNGKILPGIWHFLPSKQILDEKGNCVGDSPCPCSNSGAWNGPCFQKFEIDKITSWKNPFNPDMANPVTAFLAEFKLRESSPLHAMLEKFSNSAFSETISTSIVTTRTVKAVFLLEMTTSDTKNISCLFDTLVYGLNKFVLRSLEADLVSIMGFGEASFSPVYRAKQKFFPLSNSVSKDFEEMLQQANSIYTNFFDFPYYSNLSNSLDKAYELLASEPDFEISDNHIIVISDSNSTVISNRILDFAKEHINSSNVGLNVLFCNEYSQANMLALRNAKLEFIHYYLNDRVSKSEEFIDLIFNKSPFIQVERSSKLN